MYGVHPAAFLAAAVFELFGDLVANGARRHAIAPLERVEDLAEALLIDTTSTRNLGNRSEIRDQMAQVGETSVFNAHPRMVAVSYQC